MEKNIEKIGQIEPKTLETKDARAQIEMLIKESIAEASMRELELLGKIERILRTTSELETKETVLEIGMMPETRGEHERGKIACGNLALDEYRKVAICGNKPLNLTRTEYLLLKYLVLHKEQTVSREELLREVWGYRQAIATRATDDMIKRLRKKLKAHQATVQIQTLRGVGFYIEEFY